MAEIDVALVSETLAHYRIDENMHPDDVPSGTFYANADDGDAAGLPGSAVSRFGQTIRTQVLSGSLAIQQCWVATGSPRQYWERYRQTAGWQPWQQIR